jgi:FkbM family methyltransferase
VQRCFVEQIKPGMVVYDCGAAAGFFSLLASRLTKNPSHVISIEPVPYQLEWLRKNLEANHLHEVRVLEMALSDYDGTAKFQLESFGGGLLSAKGSLEVACSTLDSLAAKYEPPDFIKIDVETAEIRVLNGARGLLEKKRPIICLACHGGPLFPACAEILKEYGYTYSLVEDTLEFGTSLWIPK